MKVRALRFVRLGFTSCRVSMTSPRKSGQRLTRISFRPPSMIERPFLRGTSSVLTAKTRQAIFTQEQMDLVVDGVKSHAREMNAQMKRFVSDSEWISIDRVRVLGLGTSDCYVGYRPPHRLAKNRKNETIERSEPTSQQEYNGAHGWP